MQSVREREKQNVYSDAKVKINSNKREKLKKAIFFAIEFSLGHPCFYDIIYIIEDIGNIPCFFPIVSSMESVTNF